MLSYTDLKKGAVFLMNDAPHEVLEANFSRMQQRKAVVQAKIKNLATGKTVDATFQASDYFEEADVQKRPLVFLYAHRGEYFFAEPDKSSTFPPSGGKVLDKKQNRFSLKEEAVGDAARWLKPDTELTAVFFGDTLLTFSLPIKMDFVVTDAPPGVQGDRAQGGTKTVRLETGAMIQVPLFINTGDVIRVNTETEEYAERVSKSDN